MASIIVTSQYGLARLVRNKGMLIIAQYLLAHRGGAPSFLDLFIGLICQP